ncbi:hypothetical protein SDB61_09685 [Legionella pneumophila serogroup 1]
MRFICLIGLSLKCFLALANNLETPYSALFYNNEENGYFRINCDLPVSNTLSCSVEQLLISNDKIPAGGCHIIWTSPHKEIFTYNSNNNTWVNVRNENNECGIINYSSLYRKNDGEWIYKFGTHVLFKNRKPDRLAGSCKAFQNSGIEYTNKFKEMKLNCNSFTLI